MLWILSITVAALATWLCFDAMPGINWLICVVATVSGLLLLIRSSGRNLLPVAVLGALAIVLSGGAAWSASEILHFFVVLSVTVIMALAMLLSTGGSLRRITFGYTIAAPLVAFSNALISALRRASEATTVVKSPSARAGLRGVAITLPILVVFALLLASADPTFALWRDAIHDLVADWDFVPRTVFFLAMLTIVLGAYGYAVYGGVSVDPLTPATNRWLGETERLILLGGIAGLLWLFMAVQLSYLFGNLPEVPGSRVTFSEYARRGFGELTIVAAGTALVILASERYGQKGEREPWARRLTYALIAAVLFLLGSAFYRVVLYEEAYGFTIARLYAQAFMVVIAAALIFLIVELRNDLDAGRLFRRIAAAAAAVFIVLLYWNHEAWIAHRNIDRYAVTGKLDVQYLVRDLSPNAVPALVRRLSTLPEPARAELRAALARRYSPKATFWQESAYEWNFGRHNARRALATLGISAS